MKRSLPYLLTHMGYEPVAVFVRDAATVSFVSVTNGRSNHVADPSTTSDASSVPWIFAVTVGVAPTASMTSAATMRSVTGDTDTDVCVLFPVVPRGARKLGPTKPLMSKARPAIYGAAPPLLRV